MSILDEQANAAAGYKVTLVGFVANIFLVAGKLFCGIFGHSQALIADAIHSVSDLFTDLVVLLGLHLGRKTPDSRHHFGHGRLETLASAVVSVFLMGAGISLAYSAGVAIYQHTPSDPSWLALIAAGVSIGVKEFLYQITMRTGRRMRSKVMVANAWHHRSDAWSSVAVFAGVAGAQLHPSWRVLDSYAALLVSFFVFLVGMKMFFGCLAELTDAAPKEDMLEKISQCVLQVPGVKGAHKLKVRTSADLLQMQVHIVVDGQLTVSEGHAIAKEVEQCLFEDIEDVVDVVVHVDPD